MCRYSIFFAIFLLSGCATILNPNDKSYVMIRSDKIFVVDENGALKLEQKSKNSIIPSAVLDKPESKQNASDPLNGAPAKDETVSTAGSIYQSNGKLKPIKLVVGEKSTTSEPTKQVSRQSDIFTLDPSIIINDAYRPQRTIAPIDSILGSNSTSIAVGKNNRERSLLEIKELEEKLRQLRADLDT